MSAYDKDFSDAIYGEESDGRYVTESRLRKMLTHEINLVEQRLSRDKHPNKLFLVMLIRFANRFCKSNLKSWMGWNRLPSRARRRL